MRLWASQTARERRERLDRVSIPPRSPARPAAFWSLSGAHSPGARPPPGSLAPVRRVCRACRPHSPVSRYKPRERVDCPERVSIPPRPFPRVLGRLHASWDVLRSHAAAIIRAAAYRLGRPAAARGAACRPSAAQNPLNFPPISEKFPPGF